MLMIDFLLKKIMKKYNLILDSGRNLQNDLVKHIPLLIGNCAFILKHYIPITIEWYKERNRRMDELLNYLDQSNIKEKELILYSI